MLTTDPIHPHPARRQNQPNWFPGGTAAVKNLPTITGVQVWSLLRRIPRATGTASRAPQLLKPLSWSHARRQERPAGWKPPGNRRLALKWQLEVLTQQHEPSAAEYKQINKMKSSIEGKKTNQFRALGRCQDPKTTGNRRQPFIYLGKSLNSLSRFRKYSVPFRSYRLRTSIEVEQTPIFPSSTILNILPILFASHPAHLLSGIFSSKSKALCTLLVNSSVWTLNR